MKKLSRINENVLTDIIMRDRKKMARKEDIIKVNDIYDLIDVIKYEKDKQGKVLDLRHIDISNVDTLEFLFYEEREVEKIDITGWKADIRDMYKMFLNCKNLKEVKGFENLSIHEGCSMLDMFCGCEKLEKISGMENLNISCVCDMARMFRGCERLEDISFVKDWNVSNVDDMVMMFSGCCSLKDISPLKDWKVPSVCNMTEMFCKCSSLQDISPLKDWNMSKYAMLDGMFSDCAISDPSPVMKWNKLMDIEKMFKNCPIK